MNSLLIFVAICCSLTHTSEALQCYSCEGQNDDPCVTDPQATKIKTCPFSLQCYSVRKEVTDSSGTSVIIKRGCGQSFISVVSSNGGQGVAVSSQGCSANLCNTGDVRPNLNFGRLNEFLGNVNSLRIAPIHPVDPILNSDIPGDYQADYLGNFPLNFPFYANYPNAIAVPGSLEGRSLARAIQMFPIEMKTVNWGWNFTLFYRPSRVIGTILQHHRNRFEPAVAAIGAKNTNWWNAIIDLLPIHILLLIVVDQCYWVVINEGGKAFTTLTFLRNQLQLLNKVILLLKTQQKGNY